MQNLLNLGKALSKAEQRSVNGGRGGCSTSSGMCQSTCNGICMQVGAYNPASGSIDVCWACFSEDN